MFLISRLVLLRFPLLKPVVPPSCISAATSVASLGTLSATAHMASTHRVCLSVSTALVASVCLLVFASLPPPLPVH